MSASKIVTITMSPWLEVVCQQQCGWKPGHNPYRDEARAHTWETGHEAAVIRHSSKHYRLVEATQGAQK